MSMATESRRRLNRQGERMSVEEFLALPDDGTHRELIRGIVREFQGDADDPARGQIMTVRNRIHSRIVIRIGQLFANWMDGQPEPRGEVVGGEAGFRLHGTNDSLVGIDVAVVSSAMVAAAAVDPDTRMYDGPPILAVEVLSPSDTHADIVDAIRTYLEAGCVVWIVDPDLETVTIYQPGSEPRFFSRNQEIRDEPYLPGFQTTVARIFQ